jgi:hypothetical protein
VRLKKVSLLKFNELSNIAWQFSTSDLIIHGRKYLRVSKIPKLVANRSEVISKVRKKLKICKCKYKMTDSWYGNYDISCQNKTKYN